MSEAGWAGIGMGRKGGCAWARVVFAVGRGG